MLTFNAQADMQSVRIGVYENPPKIMLGPDGRPSGILGELIQEIALREDWQLQAVPCNWDVCLQLLQEGKIELMPDVAFSEQRQTLMSFHHQPALHSWSQVFRHADVEIDSVLDLDQKRVAILAGSIQQDFLKQINQEFGIQMELVRVSDLQSALNLLAEGKADALATNNLFGGYHGNGYDLKQTSILFQPARLFFATSLNQHPELLEKIDYWLEQWGAEQDSPYNRILQNWQSSVEVQVIPRFVWVGLITLLGLLLLALLTMRYLRQKVQRTQHELKMSDDKLITILNNLQAYVYIKDPQHRYLYVSPKVCELFNCTEEEILNKTDEAFFDSESVAEIFRLDDRALMSGDSIVKEEVNKLPGENEPRTFLSVKVPMRDSKGQIYALCGLATDISEQKRHKKEVHQLIFYDVLTGLPNRRLLMDRLQHSLASRHNQQGNGAVILIDLDNFRTLNDTLGHQAGDQLLTGIATRLSEHIRASDTLARFGGDEFMLLLEDLSTDDTLLLNQVEQVLDKIIAALEHPFRIQNQEYTTSASLGVALYSDSKHNPEELIKRAELAIYDAKKVGRNQIRFFDTSMQQKAEHRAELEFGLRRALKNQEFILYYQPQYHAEGEMTGVEALIRWQPPEQPLVSPGDFIPVAETTGLILPLGQWILRTACQQLVSWSEHPDTAHLTIAVNISAAQMHHNSFVDDVLSILQETGAPANRLELELTESLLIDNIEQTIEKMLLLKAEGIRFSLDDFGTGFSSLSLLISLPLDTLKVDQAFVRDMHRDARDLAVVRTIIDLGRSLALNVIAEGVENLDQRDALQRFGCRSFQGFLYARPMPIDAFASHKNTIPPYQGL
ncbi:EAL domain-containing protein [Nitrincola iocasae]|uniref:cyclic-guanylate-specific phosphodiesterase n=2 Tax=Nitrincola iocasae TaxID=2614693 RepID=A0A5J6LIJ1_9GAMM|nr:EAL domain-containing protein [Nitrincola iocasae]